MGRQGPLGPASGNKDVANLRNRYLVLLLLLLFALLAGCSSTPSTVPPTPLPSGAAPAPAPTAQPTTQPTPPHAPAANTSTPAKQPETAATGTSNPARALDTLCDDLRAGKTPTDPMTLVNAVLPFVAPLNPEQASQAFAPYRERQCIAGGVIPQGQPPLLLVNLGWTDQGAILWQQGSQWQAASLSIQGGAPEILVQSDQNGARDALFATHLDGTGHFGSLGLLRLKASGWQLVFETPPYDHFFAKALDVDHVIVISRNPGDAPLAWNANCCVPTNYEELWQRQGDRFTVVAQRLIPDPYYSVNVFVGALRAQKQEWLTKVATPDAVAGARKLQLDNPVLPFGTAPTTIDEQPEWINWSAIPANLRGPAPTVNSASVTLTDDSGKVPPVKLTLKRTDSNWVVVTAEPGQ